VDTAPATDVAQGCVDQFAERLEYRLYSLDGLAVGHIHEAQDLQGGQLIEVQRGGVAAFCC
jgi:hypothetical protein